MKLIINQNEHIPETEVIINCTSVDSRIRNLAGYIRQYSISLEGTIDDSTYYIPLDSILYIDSVDRKTFFYDKHRIFSCRYTLTELEQKLENTLFVRISKCCIVNIAFIYRTRPYANHRTELIMTNGEHLIAARSYRDALRQKLQAFNADAFLSPSTFMQREVFEHYPERSVFNVGKVLSFSASPKRVVALSYEKAELMAALGLADRLVAIAPAECSIQQVLPQYRAALESVPLLTDHDRGIPTLPELRALETDFVLGSYYALKTLEYAESIKVSDCGINLYVAEGSIPEKATMESVYRDILNLGRIFRVENRSIELVEWIRRRISVLTRHVVYTEPVRVFVYDSGESSPFTAMGGTLENDLISMAGGKNIFGKNENAYGQVAWEQVAAADPEVIILHNYMDQLSIEEKIAMLKKRKELCNVSAVQKNRFVTVHLPEVFPGVQNAGAVEKFVRAFHPALL